MKRLVACLMLAGLFLLQGALPATGSPPAGDVRGPACADVVTGQAEYVTTTRGPSVQATMQLAARSCPSVRYTLIVFDDETGGTPLRVLDVRGGHKSGTNVEFGPIGVLDPDGTVCVAVTTSTRNGKHLFDRAPDTGCVLVTLDNIVGVGQQFA
jgi:hypothetical protein